MWVNYSFAALLLPCLVCVALLCPSASVGSAPARSPEACSRAIPHLPSRSRSSSKRLDGPYRLVEPLTFLKPQRASKPREPTNPDNPSPPYIYVKAQRSPLARGNKAFSPSRFQPSPPSLFLGRPGPELNKDRSPLRTPQTPPPAPHKAHPSFTPPKDQWVTYSTYNTRSCYPAVTDTNSNALCCLCPDPELDAAIHSLGSSTNGTPAANPDHCHQSRTTTPVLS